MNHSPELEIIAISALNQYAYCPRRCYLMHAEGAFTDNVHTLRGTHEHERVDEVLHEIKQGIRIEFALPVWSDDLQLAAQAACLQEMTGAEVSAGAIYHIQSKRRRDVAITPDLIAEVAATTAAVRALLGQQKLPSPTDQIQRCNGCSMTETCSPQLSRAQQRIRQLNAQLYRTEDEQSL